MIDWIFIYVIIALLAWAIFATVANLYLLKKINRTENKPRLGKIQGPVYNQIISKIPKKPRIVVNDDASYFRSASWRREQENLEQ